MAISISSIDEIIKTHAENYSIENLFMIKEVLEGKSVDDIDKLFDAYLNFVGHKIIFLGKLELTINEAALAGCGVDLTLNGIKIPYKRKNEFKEFCAAYCRTAIALGYKN